MAAEDIESKKEEGKERLSRRDGQKNRERQTPDEFDPKKG